jgi:outer membrane protein assembly factor BamB
VSSILNGKNMHKILIVFLLLLGSCKTDTERFEHIWSFEYENPAEGLSIISNAPVAIDGSILIGPDGQVTSLDMKSGKKEWSVNLIGDAHIRVSELLIKDDTYYVKDDVNDLLLAIDIQNGEVIWQVSSEPHKFFQHANDGIDEENLYLVGDNYGILIFDQNGNFEQRIAMLDYGIETDARSIRIMDNQIIFSQRLRSDNCPTNRCGRILSIDKETQEVLWEYFTDRGGYIFEPILLEDEIIYAGVTDGSGEFVALNANDGEVIWKTLGVIGQSYTLTDSMILVNDGISLLALDKFTGKELWNTGLAFGGGHAGSNIAYLNGYVYHAHSGRLYILKGNTGEIVHIEERSPDGSQFYLLTAGEDRIYMQTNVALHAYTPWE